MLQGPSFWKFNTKIIKDNIPHAEIQERERNEEATPQWLERIKREVKEVIVSNSKRLSRIARSRQYFLERQILEYEKCQYFLPGSFREEITELKEELRLLQQARLEGVMIRPRADYIKNTDKPSSFAGNSKIMKIS